MLNNVQVLARWPTTQQRRSPPVMSAAEYAGLDLFPDFDVESYLRNSNRAKGYF